MISPKVTIDELVRLQTLYDYKILDSQSEEAFDNLTKLASEICGTPISLITFIDESRQWFKSSYGLAMSETSREISFCGHAILEDALFEVTDTLEDKRFRDNPFVTHDPNIRFYAGIPLTASNGSKLGTLCVIDKVPKKLDSSQRASLARIAKQVMSELERRKALMQTAKVSKKLANSAIFYNAVLNSADESIITTNSEGLITSFNQGAERMLGYRPDELVNKLTLEVFHDPTELAEYTSKLNKIFGKTISPGFETLVQNAKNGQSDKQRWTYIRKDGARILVNLSMTALIDDGDILLGYMGVARDVTSEVEAQISLKNLNSVLELTGEMAKIAGWQLDLQNNSTKWTKEIFKIHELQEDKASQLLQLINLYPIEAKSKIITALDNCINSASPWDIEVPFVTNKGKSIWMRSQGSPVMENVKVVKIIGAFQDITTRKTFELDMAWLNRALLMLSKTNHAITQINDEKRLITEICRVAVELGGYCMAWVGYPENDELKTVTPQASYGSNGKSYLEKLKITWTEDCPTSQLGIGEVIRTGKTCFVEDLLLEQSIHLKTLAMDYGYRGLVVMPLKIRKETMGMLALYTAESRTFSVGEIELLQELTDNLAIGITNIRAEQYHQRLSDAIMKVATNVSASVGSDFFKELVFSMTETLDADAAYVAQLQSTAPLRANMLAVSLGRELKENFTYEFPEAVVKEFFGDEDLVIVKNHADKIYPHVSMMNFYPFQAFAGLRLYDSKSSWVGLLFVFFKHMIDSQSEILIKSILKIFAARTASELERLNNDLIIQEQASLLDKTNDAIVIYDLNLLVKYWNKGAETLYGWSAEEVLLHPVQKKLRQDQKTLKHALATVLEKGVWKGQVVKRHKNGSKLIIESHWTLMRDNSGKPKSIFSINSDITLRVSAEEEVRKLAFYDALTALPNRRLLLDRIKQALSSTRRKLQYGAVVFIDLDNFKQLNDTLGHDKGDILLQEVAKRLKSCVRDIDTVARLGGDEFVILIEGLSSDLTQAQIHIKAVAGKILQALNSPFDFDGYSHTSTPSMGVAMFNKLTLSVDELLKQADVAMYQSKNAGRNRLTFYSG